MTEFWEASFQEKQTMWGFEPADSALATAELFQKRGFKEILIPGFGYGRNAKAFLDKGLKVTGIEISETAIGLAEKQFGATVKVYHGSVGEMPFDQKRYDGMYCYALLHLLGEQERAKLIQDCYQQLAPNGYMVFVTLSKNTATYGEGTEVSKDRFETRHGVNLFYYDAASIEEEFSQYGLEEAVEIKEPAKAEGSKPSQKFWQILCRKKWWLTIW